MTAPELRLAHTNWRREESVKLLGFMGFSLCYAWEVVTSDHSIPEHFWVTSSQLRAFVNFLRRRQQVGVESILICGRKSVLGSGMLDSLRLWGVCWIVTTRLLQ